jgi:perosamine synthetase
MPDTTTESTPIPITKPVFDQTERDAIARVLESGWVVQGPNVAQFEQLFAEFTGSRHAIATTSCTTALHLALIAAGIGPGDEVIVPAFTFVATANAVEYVGARPIFVDISLDTYNLDLNSLEAGIQARTRQSNNRLRAIIPVSLFGLCAPMPEINALAEKYNLQVIEDAACAAGAKRGNHHAGTEALAGCFSFHPRKAITTGEGGMVITDDDKLASSIRRLRDHGASKTDLERHLKQGGSLLPAYDELGYNFRMTDIQGALGVAQMAKLRTILDGRHQVAQRYDELLQGRLELKRPVVPSGYHHGYQSYVCMYLPDGPVTSDGSFRNIQRIESSNRLRNRLMDHLEHHKISVRQGTHAVHTLGYYQEKYGLMDRDFVAAYAADRLTITLPLYVGMTESEQTRVVETIAGFTQ